MDMEIKKMVFQFLERHYDINVYWQDIEVREDKNNYIVNYSYVHGDKPLSSVSIANFDDAVTKIPKKEIHD